MNKAVRTTVENLTEFHYSQYPDATPPSLDTLTSGDYALTRTAEGVTFIDIIDKDTGEFVSTAAVTDNNVSR